MRLIKAALFVGLVTGLGFVWQSREQVIAAYRVDSSAEEVRFEGIDLAFRATTVDPSPYRLPASPDTRQRDAGFPAVLASPARENTAVAVLGGQTVLEGTVTGPSGPLAGALVKVDRVTSAGFGSVDLVANENGQWTLDGALGGRFRVRAWLPNELTVPTSDVRFVASGQKATFDFNLTPADQTPTLELVEGGPIYNGLATEVAVVVSTRYVDELGLIVARPVSGVPVNLQVAGNESSQVLGWPNSGVTGADGGVRVNVECSLNLSAEPGATDESGDDGSPSADSDPVAEPSGTLRAITSFDDVTFPLPACLAIPELDPEVEAGEADQVAGEVQQ